MNRTIFTDLSDYISLGDFLGQLFPREPRLVRHRKRTTERSENSLSEIVISFDRYIYKSKYRELKIDYNWNNFISSKEREKRSIKETLQILFLLHDR